MEVTLAEQPLSLEERLERRRERWRLAYEDYENILRSYCVPQETLDAARTLPERPDLQAFAAAMDSMFLRHGGCGPVAMLMHLPSPDDPSIKVHELVLEPDGVERLKEAERRTGWKNGYDD